MNFSEARKKLEYVLYPDRIPKYDVSQEPQDVI